MKKVKLLKRRVLAISMALAMILSSLVVPQGVITAYAEEDGQTLAGEDEQSSSDGDVTIDVEDGGTPSTDSIKAVEDTLSPYSPTQIKNGDFETTPWESFVLNGVIYTALNTSASGTITSSFPNGVGEGWNTTETQPYSGNLFEVWPTGKPLDPKEADRDFTKNGTQFIEMNTTNPACLYQDLATQGGDVIKWTLQHAARRNLGFQEQRMYVTIGKPEIDEDGEIVAATGIGKVSNNTITDHIDTKIQADGKAEYRYDNDKGSFSAKGTTAYANTDELKGLSVMRTDESGKDWYDAAGIYIVPDGQDVTRFAFCADASSKTEADTNVKDLSGGNFLDNITFSTLVGNLKATKTVIEGTTSAAIKVTGFWGDEDSEKHLIVKVGDTVNKIDMSEVKNKNFVVTVPDTRSGEEEVEIYHEKYSTAAKKVAVSHEHTWVYGSSANEVSAECSNNDEAGSCAAHGTTKTLTINADDAVYTGNPYTGAYFVNAEKTEWLAGGLDVPQIYYEGTDETVYTSSTIAPTNVGTYQTTITVGTGAGLKTAVDSFTISQKPITTGGITFTFNKSSYPYDGTSKTPSLTIKDGSQSLIKDRDYMLSGDENGTDKGTYRVTIKGQGNYKDETTKIWKITDGVIKNITKNEFSGVYDGLPHSASVSVNNPSGTTISYSDAEDGTFDSSAPEYTEADTYTIYYQIEKTNYATTRGALTVEILQKPINSSGITVTIDHDSYVHDGGVKTPVITVKDGANTLTEGTHYTLSGNTTGSAISGDVDYKITVQGIGNYTGTVDKTWKIVSSGSGSGDSGTGDSGGSGGSGSGSGGSGGSGSGSSSSGGAGGTQPTTPTENFDIPVKNENTVKVEAEIKDGTANVSEITNDTIGQVVNNKDEQSKVDTITIDLSGAKQEVTGVTLSKESVKTLAETTAQKDNGIDTATIELSKATVELDHKALETLAEQAKGTQIQLVVEDKDRRELNNAQQATLGQHQVATTFEAYFTSDGQRIHDFKGGKAVVSIDFTPETGKDASYYHLVYVAESGDMTRYKTKYQNRKLMFTTTHFSDYAVIYDTGERNETEKTEEEKEDNSSGTDGKVTMDKSYSRLRLRVPISTKTTNVLKWTKQTGADGYVIYSNHCNTGEKKYKIVQRVVIKDGSTTTWVDKNLDGGTYYKYCIKAYKLVNGKKVWLAKSKVVHSTTTGGKYGNAKTVKVNKTALSLTKGKTFTIKAEQVVKDLPIKKHTDIKYESSNTKVASVTGKGVIKAKKKGTCYIYVYAQNGMYRRMKVTVK